MSQQLIESLSEKLKARFGTSLLAAEQQDMYTITLKKESILDVLNFLYEDEELQFRFLTTLCGIHFPNAAEQLGVIYHLHSWKNNLRIRIKIYTTVDKPEILSATPLFSAANWMERETYDFFGIEFKGHPNLKRILNVDDMIMFPLRKEFPLEDQVRIDKDDTMFGR